jgi:hypothetical protein
LTLTVPVTIAPAPPAVAGEDPPAPPGAPTARIRRLETLAGTVNVCSAPVKAKLQLTTPAD